MNPILNRMVSALRNKWVGGVIGLTALSLLIWYGAEYVRFGTSNSILSPAARLAIILSLASIWLSWNLCLFWVNRRTNRQLLDQLHSTDAAADPDDQRSREEQETIQQRFQDAMAVLKKSRFLSRHGSRSLYQLPWYIIIGPPGAGKTTALVNSGLEFPLAHTLGKEAIGGIGGTRDCDWWFTNEAVLIDTAGRYTTQDSHRVIDNTAWNKFIDMLKKYRTRRPINGAMLAISLQDLMVQTAEQRLHLAKILRLRINELQQQLGIRFPIYVTFTKCDLVAGFSEYFANLSPAEREQVWGITFSGDPATLPAAPLDSLPAELDALSERLNERLLWRINQERSLDRRSVLQGFPARFESLNDVIYDFIKRTFAANRYDLPPMLRGVYFTSATQEGCPIDRMMASVSASFGLEREMGRQQTNAGKSFFLNRLLRDVIFPEAELVGVNRRFENSMLWLRRGCITALSLLVFGTLLVWTGSVTRNQLFMNEVKTNLTRYEQAQLELETDNHDSLQSLAVMSPLRQSARVYDKQRHPWLVGMGLYDSRVDQAAKELYADKLLHRFLTDFSRSLEHQLNRMGPRDDDLLDTLKVYLMLYTREKRHKDAITAYAKRLWAGRYPGQAAHQRELLEHLQTLLQLEFPSEYTADERVVERAREQLRRIPVAQRLYAQLKHQSPQVFDLYPQIAAGSLPVFDIEANDARLLIPQLYTKAGFRQANVELASSLLKSLAQDQWVYGQLPGGEDFSDSDRERIGREVRQLYLNDYASRWQSMVNGLKISRFSSMPDALDKLAVLADPVYSPLLAAVTLTAEHTELTPRLEVNVDTRGPHMPVSSAARRAGSVLAEVATDQLTDHYQPNPVDLRFKDLQQLVSSDSQHPAKIHEYLAAIQDMQHYLADINNAVDPGEAAFKAAKNRFGGAGNDAIRQLRNKASSAPAPVNTWLNSIADNSWSLVLSRAQQHLNEVWRDQVYVSYRRSLSNRYPLMASSRDEAPIREFNLFFQPQGIEQRFVNDYLRPFVDTRSWKIRQLDGQGLAINATTLAQLRRADDIRQAFFNDSPQAAITFRLEPTKLDASVRLFALELGNHRVPYSHGPRTISHLGWTGGEDTRARLIFEDLNQSVHRKHFEGDWAWFRLLDESEIQPTERGHIYQITFHEQGRRAQFKLIANSSINPFDRSLLHNYRCPQTL